MCGISGIVDFSRAYSNGAFLGEELKQMGAKLAHRGPDDSGVWQHPELPIGLAHNRLSILDLSNAGHQPMVCKETGNCIAFNGEIFNFQRIKQSKLSGETFLSGTDTETILKLYKKQGLEMLNELNGMFAFALWDESKKELLIARDKCGKKPLYFTEQNGRFVFASELKALFSLPWIKKELDEHALYDFLTYNLALPPSTLFKNIYKLHPGHVMRINSKCVVSYDPYYSLKKKKIDFSSEQQLSDVVFETLAKSVKDRMISDVPVGAFLSGGVDSSAVVALMRQNTSKQIHTFTIGFEDQPNYDEQIYSEKVARLFDTRHHTKIVKPDDLLNFLPKIVDIYDEPQADTTSIPMYFLSQLAKEQKTKVVLNGDGADELFAGYNSYQRNNTYFPVFKKLSTLPNSVLRAIYKSSLPFNNGHPVFEFLSRLEKGQEFYWPGAQSIKESQKVELISQNFKQVIGDKSSYRYVNSLKERFANFNGSGSREITDLVEWMSFTGFVHADIERFLFRSDRLGMAHSIECRSPFLNIDMVELALSVPSEYKIKNKVPKYILKKSLERILPDEVLYRKKMGFCLPINEWASKTIVDYVESNLSSHVANYDIFNNEKVTQQIQSVKSGNTNHVNHIWTIYFLMSWLNKWF